MSFTTYLSSGSKWIIHSIPSNQSLSSILHAIALRVSSIY